jgi:hypothetical protein|tara:strand:+ start:2240 stop:2605 length:366 start_codon:yes stop_codon:yes gene_type:complete
MKSIIASGLLLGMAHGAAIAGPYVNVETNSGWTGSQFGGASIDNHIGYEGDGWSIQGGPTIVLPNNDNDPFSDNEAEVELSGKINGSFPVTENLNVYGELSFITGDDDNSYGTKIGATYKF